MSVRVIDAAQWQSQPWKNGGGITHEILRLPDQSDWRLRLSVAEIHTPGPFSVFPGIDRLIALAEGAGFALDIDDAAPIAIADTGQFTQFSGDATTNCRLLDGTVRDLNLMTERATLSVCADTLVLSGTESRRRAGTAFTVVFVFEGEIRVQQGATSSPLTRWQTLVSDAPEELVLSVATNARATLLHAAVDLRQATSGDIDRR